MLALLGTIFVLVWLGSFVSCIWCSAKMNSNVLVALCLGLFCSPISGFGYMYMYIAGEKRPGHVILAALGLLLGFWLCVLLLVLIYSAFSQPSASVNNQTTENDKTFNPNAFPGSVDITSYVGQQH